MVILGLLLITFTSGVAPASMEMLGGIYDITVVEGSGRGQAGNGGKRCRRGRSATLPRHRSAGFPPQL